MRRVDRPGLEVRRCDPQKKASFFILVLRHEWNQSAFDRQSAFDGVTQQSKPWLNGHTPKSRVGGFVTFFG